MTLSNDLPDAVPERDEGRPAACPPFRSVRQCRPRQEDLPVEAWGRARFTVHEPGCSSH